MWLKGSALLFVAACIDLLKATVDLAFLILGMFAGTIGGAAAGCVVGGKIGGYVGAAKAGCAVGAVILGYFGTFLNPVLAPLATPVATALGIAVNASIDISMGLALIFLLKICKMYYAKSTWSVFVFEQVPILNVLPGWSFLVIYCMFMKAAEEKKLPAGKLAIAIASGSASGIMRATMQLKENNRRLAQRAGTQMNGNQFDETLEERAESPLEHDALQRSRNVMRDIRTRAPERPRPEGESPYAQAA